MDPIVVDVVVGGAAVEGVVAVAVTSILGLFVSYGLTKFQGKMLTSCVLVSILKRRFVAVVGILHVTELFSPVPEHVVGNAHAQSRPQPQIQRFHTTILLTEHFVASPQIFHDVRSPEVYVSRLQRHFIEKIVSLGESSFARK
jgi:hypothetical protein